MLTWGFALHRVSCTVAQRSTHHNGIAICMAWPLWRAVGRPWLDPLPLRGVSHRLGRRRYVVVGREQRGLDGSAYPERGAHLLQHLLLPAAHLLGTEPQ